MHGAWVVHGSEASQALDSAEIGGSIVRLQAAALTDMLPELPYLNAVLSRYNCVAHAPHRHLRAPSSASRGGCWLTATGPDSRNFPSPQSVFRPRWESTSTRYAVHWTIFSAADVLRKAPGPFQSPTRKRWQANPAPCFQLTTNTTDGYIEEVTGLSRTYSK